ncbi:MAG: phospho-N-acetylmuramoyl-pentapeptide-transferase [Clostridia bacterium]|nr:phospho-N-acetylmuramoyl-pentapeptide-transferase [Clostridia bacterium]
MVIYFILSVLIAFVGTVLLSKKFIPVLISKKLNQPIYEIGPRWHKSKAGTPTMGGLFFIAAITLSLAILSFFAIPKEELPRVWITLGMALLFGVIGFIDDRAKLLKKQNEGLTATQKFLCQLAAGTLYIVLMALFGDLDTVLAIPFFGVEWDLGYAYYPLLLIFLVGMDNSVNLTDGIDGLCASTTAVLAVFFAVCGFLMPGTGETLASVAILSGALFGGAVGFLVYNWNPARIFMGDTGSLFLGGLLTGLAVLIDQPLVIAVIGLWFIMETVSVILQVGSYKLTKKRIFKMAPIHHHFEKCGWSEVKIVTVSIVSAVLLSVLTYFFM